MIDKKRIFTGLALFLGTCCVYGQPNEEKIDRTGNTVRIRFYLAATEETFLQIRIAVDAPPTFLFSVSSR